VCVGSGATLQHQQQAMEFADEEEELLRDHEQSLRQLEVLTAFMTACLLYVISVCNVNMSRLSPQYLHCGDKRDILSQANILLYGQTDEACLYNLSM